MTNLVMLHSYWRWLVLAAAVGALAGAVIARRGAAGGWAGRAGLLYTIAFDIEVLIGLILWVGQGRWEAGGFYGFVHPLLMLLALGLAHMGRGREKRARAAGAPGGGEGLAGYAGSLALMLLAIPWNT